ncbi:hypothetical protein PITC_078780 [Penicillium italicum]|uniref:Uncharacterized protein n=1 Tax=Penicillium italicum TaxID=40296 RepID=A0A0A2KX90_PENIT|nr:hypothetical protein PITC_078780 [Penicillium italicum]
MTEIDGQQQAQDGNKKETLTVYRRVIYGIPGSRVLGHAHAAS